VHDVSRFKTYRSVRVSDRLALVGAALLVGGALLSIPSWQASSWQTASFSPTTPQREAQSVSQGQGSGDSASGRQRFTISQFLFRRR
jgi:hypothetical protein